MGGGYEVTENLWNTTHSSVPLPASNTDPMDIEFIMRLT
jgi:hypothetical protein